MSNVTLAAANVKITHNKQENLNRFKEIIDHCAGAGVDLLVLPEVALQGYADFGYRFFDPEFAEQRRNYMREAEPIPGPSTEIIRQAVERHGMFVQLGMAESVLDGNIIYNSTALIGPEGVVGVFRKVHAYPDYPWFNWGESVPVFTTPHGKVGSLICYDIYFPELSRTYALRGADVLLMSTAWPMEGHERATDFAGGCLDLMTRATAMMNQMWLVVSNHCETDAYSTHDDYYGGSQIIDPCGRVLAYAAQNEEVLVESVDLVDAIHYARTEAYASCNFIQDRRPELYGALVDESFKYPNHDQARPNSILPRRDSVLTGNGAHQEDTEMAAPKEPELLAD